MDSKHQHPPLTWGQVQAWARDNKVPDDAVMVYAADKACHLTKIHDLDSSEPEWEGDEPLFILQRVWG